MSKSIENDNWEDPHDRWPSEIFTAIDALQEDGTQTERLKRRADAIRILLDILLTHTEGRPEGTLYDHLAIRAFNEGSLPPKKQQGRPKPDMKTALIKGLSKKMLRLEYAKLRKELNAAECLDSLATKHELNAEWLNNVIRASSATLKTDTGQSEGHPDLVDMWRQWKLTRKSRNK